MLDFIVRNTAVSCGRIRRHGIGMMACVEIGRPGETYIVRSAIWPDMTANEVGEAFRDMTDKLSEMIRLHSLKD